MYTPVLRNRQSEIAALSELSSGIKQNTVPLIDIARPNENQDSVKYEKYVINGINRIKNNLDGFKNLFLDSSELPVDFRINSTGHPLIEAANAINKNINEC